ncbi:hypothetical protein B0T25DRAFT_564751 [Lasiosphaeria hispida]|uniref:RING-type domain-containing protein n=1 Tax=Lasiosphaeria hispida TaxID=260671 RepID=A0AAJ0HQT9_9PEZI|nr:hypothetical protein B0T25DRAFT_564751 [Lasiosphaeria hispida]
MRRKARRSSYFSDKKDLVFGGGSSSGKPSSTTKIQQVEASCPICQEPVGSRTPEGITEGWSTLPCGHRFGSYCIKHYLRIVADDRPSCPVCRQVAYHSCGHPVLPVLVTSGISPESKTKLPPGTMLHGMDSFECGYCRQARCAYNRPRARKRPDAKWKAAVTWVFTLATRPRRLLPGGSNTSDSRSSSGAGAGAGAETPVPRDARGYFFWPANNGPWIDPFPRARDPEWEKWWDRQAPSGA